MGDRVEGNKTLCPDDAVSILEEILEAKTHARYIGLKLQLPTHIVDGIHTKYSDPQDHLHRIIEEYLKQVAPTPSWSAIADALKSPLVNLPHLAKRIEDNHCSPVPAQPDQGMQQWQKESVVELSPTPSDELTTHLQTRLEAASLRSPDSKSPRSTTDGRGSTATSSANLQPSSPTAISTFPMSPWSTADGREICGASNLQPPSPNEVVACFTSVGEIRERIAQFEECFKEMKRQTREGLERKASVQVVVERLTDLRADDKPDHKMFLRGNLHIMFRAENHFELYGILNSYWDYLAYHLLDHLIREFSIREAKNGMAAYKIDLQRFRRATPLKLFCQAQRRERVKPPTEFREMVAEFDWPESVTLEVAEDFRHEYASHYSLRECAMMLVSLSIGSFIITWIVPESIVESLKTKVPEKLFKRHSVTKLQIAGDLIYPSTQHPNVPVPSPSPSTSHQLPAAQASPHPSSHDTSHDTSHDKAETEQEYDFVEQPSEDFFCPVTRGLLLQPHLTACCGQHLSDEAATRIQGGGGACPMCMKLNLSTTLNKHFLCQVRQLRVFCRHKERGCGWEGELSALEHHVQSCPRKNPLGTKLGKLSLVRATKKTSSSPSTLPSSSYSTLLPPTSPPSSIPSMFLVQTNNSSTPYLPPNYQQLPPTQRQTRRTASSLKTETHEKKTESSHLPRPSPWQQEKIVLKWETQPSPWQQRKIVLKWETRSKAPRSMSRGAAVVSGNVAYFNYAGTDVHAYHVDEDKWTRLPDCNQKYFGFAVINSLLTAVGGRKSHSESTNTLTSLREGKWVELLPPMSTNRVRPAVVTTDNNNYVIVAGGETTRVMTWLTTVEVLNCSSLQWTSVCDMPKSLYFIAATICNDRIYCLDMHNAAYTCTVDSLLSSSQSLTADTHTDSQTTSPHIWRALPDVPAGWSTPASLCGQLVAVGGMGVSTIHQYNMTSGSWEAIGSMPTARRSSLVVVLPGDKMLVVGGVVKGRDLDTVELGVLC